MEPRPAPPEPRPLPPERGGFDYAPLAVTVVLVALVGGLVATLLHWSAHQPAVLRARHAAELMARPPPAQLAVPVQGVRPTQIADTFGAPRGRTRQHQGVDIFAPRGTPVLAATEGLVASVRDGGLGGRQVWVLGPGGERHYYAHLDDWVFALRQGDVVRAGDPLGVVGDTGNARGTPPHLHYGVYASGGAVDPLPRLRAPAAE